MGKCIERNMDWLNDVVILLNVNVRKGAGHTVEYKDKTGNYCVVRVPAAFTNFLSLYTKANKRKLRKAA